MRRTYDVVPRSDNPAITLVLHPEGQKTSVLIDYGAMMSAGVDALRSSRSFRSLGSTNPTFRGQLGGQKFSARFQDRSLVVESPAPIAHAVRGAIEGVFYSAKLRLEDTPEDLAEHDKPYDLTKPLPVAGAY